MNEINPNWRTPEPDELVCSQIDFVSGDEKVFTAEAYRNYLNLLGVKRGWTRKQVWALNWQLGYRRYLHLLS